MGLRNWIRDIVFVKRNTRVYNFIFRLIELEMSIERYINIINSFNKNKKVPNGDYCFDDNSLCPYYSVSTIAYYLFGEEYSGYCHKLKRSDLIEPGTVHRLAKVCRINLGDTFNEI